MALRKLSSATRTRIRKHYDDWKTVEEITKLFPRIKPTLKEINKIIFCPKWVRRKIVNWIVWIQCNRCEQYKPHIEKYFPDNWRGWLESRCRWCKRLQNNNLRRLRKNMWIKRIDRWPLCTKRRWIREKLIRLIDLDYYKTNKKNIKLRKKLWLK
jgi:hypothetical protein